ncbi:UPF0267 protein [Shewanella sp. NFH-SH190041]|nr:UPF0267 protein [Shewanella sp. NFH-SH190041]
MNRALGIIESYRDKDSESMCQPLTEITFFERFEADILHGVKTITLRDKSESGVYPGQVLPVATFEQQRHFCNIEVLAITPIAFSALTELEAAQENMTLSQLQQVIQQIYPGITELYKISFRLI